MDVILDMVAGDYVAREVSAWPKMAPGHHCRAGRVQSTFNAGLVLRRRLTITGSTLRGPASAAFSRDCAGLRRHVWP